MDVTVYLRPGALGDQTFAEDAAARRYFTVANSLGEIAPGRLVVGRYSLSPFYEAIEQQLAQQSCVLLNSYEQHRVAADLGRWYELLADMTFDTWNDLDHVPDEIPLVVKGETNGRKHSWSETFYAADKQQAADLAGKLRSDPLLARQQLYFRAFTPLNTLIPSDGKHPPIVEEYRFFVLDRTVLASGFYWAQHYERLLAAGVTLAPQLVPADFLAEVISRIGGLIRFYAVDIARAADGRWFVVEVNDGSSSGLATIDPDSFYRALADRLLD